MYRVKRTHSAKIQSLFPIAHTGVDIIIRKGKRTIKVEVKETYGKRAKFCVKPKDMEANVFLFYYPPQNLYILVRRTAMPKVEGVKATSFGLSQVKSWAFFTTVIDESIIAEVKSL